MYAKYTVHLKTLLEDGVAKAKIEHALSSYPLYVKKSKEEYIPSYIPTREELNASILNAYKYREIGFETPGRFIDELKIAMDEIMPKYNLLFFSADQDFNIIYNVDYIRETERKRNDESNNNIVGTNTGSSKSNTETNSESTDTSNNTTSGTGSSSNTNDNKDNSKSVKSNTPQGQLDIGTKSIDNVNYGDEAQWNESISHASASSSETNTATSESEAQGNAHSTGESTTEETRNNTIAEDGTRSEDENITETVKGNYGVVSAQRLVQAYRETIINIVQMIINDKRIKELFMGVY